MDWYISLMFRSPLQFDKLVGRCMNYVDSNNRININSIVKTTVCSVSPKLDCGAAICSNIMRAGKHSVSFQVNDDHSENYGVGCGIMRPTTNDITSLTGRCDPAGTDLSTFSLKDYKRLHRNNIDCCLLNSHTGSGTIRKRWKQWQWMPTELILNYDELDFDENSPLIFDWEGQEETEESSFKIGMVLDLDEGTLDVYKNDRRLGTMQTGLVGEYCWVVSLVSIGASITIGR